MGSPSYGQVMMLGRSLVAVVVVAAVAVNSTIAGASHRRRRGARGYIVTATTLRPVLRLEGSRSVLGIVSHPDYTTGQDVPVEKTTGLLLIV